MRDFCPCEPKCVSGFGAGVCGPYFFSKGWNSMMTRKVSNLRLAPGSFTDSRHYTHGVLPKSRMEPKAKQKAKPEAKVPPELTKALARNAKARAVFADFAPSHRREYCEWIGEAKQEVTKAKRVEQAVEWIAEGKQRNWKYQR